MSPEQISRYLAILTIRQQVLRRGAMITGVLFLSVMVFSIYVTIQLEWEARFILPLLMFDLMAALLFIMAQVRYEINKEKIELLNLFK